MKGWVGCFALAFSALCARGLAFSTPLGQPVDLRGVFVIVNLDYVFSSPKGLEEQAAASLPGVDGITLVHLWSSLEPSKGVYDWRSLDKWMHFADSLGKKVTLAIKAGSGTPPWLFQAQPTGAGATPLTFVITPHEGKTSVCDTEVIAAPWDPAFLAQWDSMLVALSAHLTSTGTYGTLTALRLTGINRTSDELRLPAESAQSTGLSCVTNADSIWMMIGYRPSKLLSAWDAITTAFGANFPDKSFSVAIITNPPQVPFPAIAEDGTLITDSLHDQNPPLLTLAAQKFLGRLVVQFNFLFPGTPANTFVVQAAQSYGTMIAYQTNNYFSLSDSGAACGGTVANPSPCSASSFLQMLETGIYPIGHQYTLRSQYIEVWPINASAFPAEILQAHTELLSSVPQPQVSITLGTPQQLMHLGKPDAMAMSAVPDMHTAIVQQPDSSYRLWIAGRFKSDSVEGATGLIATRDFLTYSPVGSATTAQVVLPPSCRPGTISCWNNFDADYAGADLVFPASNGTDLVMLYHAQTKYYGVRPPNRVTDPSWCVMGVARSTDNGVTWSRIGAGVSGSDPKPDTIPNGGVLGVVEPGAIVANGYIYAYYAYFPTPGYADAGPPTIQMARAPVSSDGMPGSWTKYCAGTFDVQSGLGGLGSQVVPTVFGDTRPAQPWPVFSTYLNAYVMIFLCGGGWYFSTSTDLVDWSVPTNFFAAPYTEFTAGKPTDENVVMVTPGNPAQVIGRTGYVLYAHTPAWGDSAHELWMRPFTFNSPATSAQLADPGVPATFGLEQNYPNPFNPSTTIAYTVGGVRNQESGFSLVHLAVYDLLGREVETLVNEREQSGSYAVHFDGSRLASGTYFLRLQAGSFVSTRKMVLVK